MKKEDKKLLVLNIAMIILEVLAFILTIKWTKTIGIQYYTEDSNLLMLVVSIILTYFILTKKKIPKWLEILHHMAVLGLTITFLVVLFILAPMYNFDYATLMFRNVMLFFHTLCPILAIITYLFYSKTNIEKEYLPHTMIFTIIYSVVILICNICRVVEGPYPFLMVYKQSVIVSVLWIILLEGGTFLISWALYKLKKRTKIKGL